MNMEQRRFKVAVIGGGPGGLGAAIELEKLSFVDWELYEKKATISETGGGIALQQQTWRLLEQNGAAKNIAVEDYFRPASGVREERRNGRTGELLIRKFEKDEVPPQHHGCRLVRSKLQSALLRNVKHDHIHVAKKLVGIEHLPDNRVRISFEDGFVDEVDLLVGADGIRSVTRKTAFPDFEPSYKGQSAYRTIVSKKQVKSIDGIPWAPVFWKHTSGLYVFTCPLGNDDFEVTARIRRPSKGQDQVSWGRPFQLHQILHEFDDFCQPVRQLLQLAAKGETQEFALFAGARLPRIVSHGNIALVGDASHPQSGNFGSGAALALEDVYTLAKSLQWAWSRHRSLSDALDLLDSVRSPYYKRLYKLVDKFACIKSALWEERLPTDEEIRERVHRISAASESWMYDYMIDKVVAAAI